MKLYRDFTSQEEIDQEYNVEALVPVLSSYRNGARISTSVRSGGDRSYAAAGSIVTARHVVKAWSRNKR